MRVCGPSPNARESNWGCNVTVKDVVELFHQEGFTVTSEGSFIRDGLTIILIDCGPDALRVQFKYPQADAQGTLHMLIDQLDLRDGLLKSIASAESIKKTAIAFYGSTHHYTGL